MLFVETLAGFIFIICGLLVKKNPNLIAGYNTMSAKEKKNINIKKLSTYLHNALIIIGVLTVIVGAIIYFLDVKPMYRFLVSITIMVIGLLYTLLNTPKS